MFGLTHTTSPRLTKRPMPPRPSIAFSVSLAAIWFMAASVGLAPAQRAMVMSAGLPGPLARRKDSANRGPTRRPQPPMGQHSLLALLVHQVTPLCG